MKSKGLAGKFLAIITAITVMTTCFVMPAVSAATVANDTEVYTTAADYGTATTLSDGSITLNFGQDSITTSGGGSIITDSSNGNVYRPDNLKTDSSDLAVLTLSSVTLTNSGLDTVSIYAANKNTTNVSINVGETEVAAISGLTSGSWTDYKVFTASLTTTEAEGNVTLNISGVGAKTYCGNYVYVKFYSSSAATATPAPTSEASNPTATPNDDTDDDTAIYLNESYSFEERAADLVSRMTLEEKISQIGYTAPAIDRLGVSAYSWWKEAIHGVARQGVATSFPSPLSMSNTWNRDLVYTLADITSTEARIKNNRLNLSYYSPTVNMARDPRWGRNEETYGEDPYLTSELAIEFVNGMQGDDEKYLKTMATIKHFAANNNETNRRGGSSIMSEFNFRNYYTKVFQNIVEEADPAAVMASYNATSIYRNGELLYNYVPSAANSYLLTDLLRSNWGFDGIVTTDCGAGDDLTSNARYQQGVLGSDASALSGNELYGAMLAAAYKAGLNIECSLGGGNKSQSYGQYMIDYGYLTEEELEVVVYELFLQRFKTGEFDSTTTYRNYDSSLLESDEHVAVAEEVAEESWVLLKNDDNTLPLDSSDTNIVLVGNRAAEVIVGDYSGSPTKTVAPADGIKEEIEAAFPNSTVTYLGNVADTTPLLNIKSITLVDASGNKTALDLSTATVSGATLSDGVITDVTKNADIIIPNVDFSKASTIEMEISTGVLAGGTISVHYGDGGPVGAYIASTATDSTSTYVTCSAEYTGADGGYSGVADMQLTIEANTPEFSVETYKSALDEADYIIAYASTTTSDSSESNDRSSIDLPTSESHVQSICDAYPDKTIVVMQTVGQINVEPFMNKCKAILWTSYNGQTQGTAIGKVLTGEVNPSGKLSTTWYQNSDVQSMELSNRSTQTIGGISGYYTDYDIQADGTNPGHTYQYYSNTPIYPFGYGLSYTDYEYSNITISSSSADANDTITVTADIKNTGSVDGKEAVQLYISHPTSDDTNMPKMQLKEFDKIELAAGETKTVTFTLDISDFSIFSETDQKTYVPTGTYTIYVGKNAEDADMLSTTLTVSGELNSVLKTVTAYPDGITVNGLVEEDGVSNLESKTVISSNVTAYMTDETEVDLSAASVQYESSNSSVAAVSSDGIVTSGLTEGIATITVTVTVDGVTLTDSYPVVNSLETKPSEADVTAAKAEITSVYEALPKSAYSDENYAELTAVYQEGLETLDACSTKTELSTSTARIINNLNSVTMDNLDEVYTITSVNPEYIKNGMIDYSDNGGIPMYSGATGTITSSNPYSGIQLIASDADGNVIDNDSLTWQVMKFDESDRKVAEINSETGELTVYGNGIIQITAANVEGMCCGRLMVHVNMQVEGEYADEANGADLTDAQSGSSGGYDVGSSGDAWIEYKSIKLSNLESISVRYAGKNAGTIYVSLDKSSNADSVIAQYSLSATGGWSTWAEQELTLSSDVLYDAQLNGLLDEYGCATVYIQTNGTNLDYFRLNYIENNDEQPYIIEKVLNKADGKVKITLTYRGSTLATTVPLIAAVYDSEDVLKSITTTDACGTGEYELSTGADDGDSVSYYVWNGFDTMVPLAEKFDKTYNTPVDSEIVVYSLNDSAYQVLTGGTDEAAYTSTVNGLSGYGAWTLDSGSTSYTYYDVNEKAYDYTFSGNWKAGAGSTTKRCLYFTPKAPCIVTAVFYGSEAARSMNIYQSETVNVTQPGTASVKGVSLEITDTSLPVYVYGGSSNKNLYAIIVEYYGTSDDASTASELSTKSTSTATSGEDASDETESVDRAVSYTTWGDSQVVLTKNDTTGETKVWVVVSGDLRVQLSTEYFYESDIDYKYDDEYTINAIAEYNGRLYAGCDNGLVIVFTDCAKCYKLKKAADIDIKTMSIDDGVMYISDGETDIEISMSDLGADTIEADEADILIQNGAVLVDVRSTEEFSEKSVDGSINIPVNEIEDGLSAYDTDTVLIFCCASGNRAQSALETAKAMGFTNVYNLSSIDKLL